VGRSFRCRCEQGRALFKGQGFGLVGDAAIGIAVRANMTRLRSREGSVTTEARRAPLTALAGLVALALTGAIAPSDVADAALVDLGAFPQCDAQTTLRPDEDLEPREQIDRIVAANDRRPGDRHDGHTAGAVNIERTPGSRCGVDPRAPRRGRAWGCGLARETVKAGPLCSAVTMRITGGAGAT
jgi:hypothetical protein